MPDIRLIAKNRPDAIFTRDGHKVVIADFDRGIHRNLMYGHVHRDGKQIPHYWFADGRFKNFKDSPLDLIIKIK